MTTILVVDDDTHIRDVVVFALQREGYAVLTAGDGVEGLARFGAGKPDLVILDVMMPEMDGRECCREIRRVSDVPIIFLTAMDDEVDMIVGLELGGDDYITKPFSPRQLIARVRAVLRRMQKSVSVDDSARISHGKLVLDTGAYEAMWDGRPVTLTVTEFSLLLALARRPGQVLSRNQLMDEAYDGVVVSDRTIDSHVRRVRSKFGEAGGDPVQTIHGAGYRLSDCG